MKLFKSIIFPLILIFGCVILLFSYPYFFSKINRYDSLGFLSLIEEKSLNLERTYSPNRTTDQLDNRLFSGEKISGKIKATENNLGILLFRFTRMSAKVSDSVVFRVKEQGENGWYYENNYQADQFQPDQYFTFGFPPITESKNKTYFFEIESLAGTYANGVGVSLQKPQVAMVYKFTQGELKSFDAIRFTSKKFVYALNNINIWENLQIFGLLLFIYLFIYFMIKRSFSFKKL